MMCIKVYENVAVIVKISCLKHLIYRQCQHQSQHQLLMKRLHLWLASSHLRKLMTIKMSTTPLVIQWMERKHHHKRKKVRKNHGQLHGRFLPFSTRLFFIIILLLLLLDIFFLFIYFFSLGTGEWNCATTSYTSSW